MMNFAINSANEVVLCSSSKHEIFFLLLVVTVAACVGTFYVLGKERLKREHEEREALRKGRR